MDLSGYVDGVELKELTECPKCGIMYEEKKLNIGYCGTCFVAENVRNYWEQMQYLRWGTIPV
jgi:ribosomal protein S27AE